MAQLVEASGCGAKVEMDTYTTVARIAGNLKSMHFLQFTTASFYDFYITFFNAFSSNDMSDTNLNFSFRDLLQVHR